MTNENNIQKGIKGEKIVSQMIKEMDLKGGVLLDNAIFKFPSILYSDGYLTVQIDHLIITKQMIFCIETKYYEHLIEHNFAKPQWVTDYNEEIENPIYQNRKHKEILSNILETNLNEIITIEAIIGSDIKGYSGTGQRPNDYICDENTFKRLLFLLLETEYDNEYDFNTTKKLVLKKCLTYGKTKEEVDEIEKEHLKRLKFARSINVWMRRRNRRMYHYGDVAYCEVCGKYLAFRKFPSIKKGNQRNSKDYLVGCTGYNTYSSRGCVSKPIYNFEEMNIVEFAVPEGEEQNMTFVEIMEELKEIKDQNNNLRDLLKENQEKNRYLQRKVNNLQEENRNLSDSVITLERANRNLESENHKFSKIIGKFYFRKER